MSHQGRGEPSCGLGWMILGKMCSTHRDAGAGREAGVQLQLPI